MLPIIFQNEEIIAINKPHGLFVHRSRMSGTETEFAMYILRDQIGQKVYPAHRLDRKTSGVLLFTKTKDGDRKYQGLFQNKKTSKKYLTIVRGYIPEEGTIDYALTQDDKTKDALTHYKRLETFEIDLPFGLHQTSRYSLVELIPMTGRFHQLRKHMAHIRHPIIGDRPHGCNQQNRLWKEHFEIDTMFLHAQELVLNPTDEDAITIVASISDNFEEALNILRNNRVESRRPTIKLKNDGHSI